MNIPAKIKNLIRQAGFNYASTTLESLRKEHAADRLANPYADQWTMRLSEALGMHRMNREELQKLAS